MTIRSSGSAIGAFFLYFIVEQILGGFAGAIGPTAVLVLRFAPNAVFKTLWTPGTVWTVPLKEGQVLDIGASTFVAVGGAYVVAFLVAAFLTYRRRDL